MKPTTSSTAERRSAVRSIMNPLRSAILEPFIAHGVYRRGRRDGDHRLDGEVQGRIDVPVGAHTDPSARGFAGRRIDTGTLRQRIMSVDVRRPVKISMIKIISSGAAEDGRRQEGVEWSNLAFRT